MRNANYNAMSRYKPAAGSVPPLTRKGEATRLRILEAAIVEIGKHGYQTASVSTITNHAGVGQGTFYLYFKSKDDILTELVTRIGTEVREILTQATRSSGSPLGAERACIAAFLSYVHTNKNLYRVFMESQFINAELFNKCYQDFADLWVKLLDIGTEQGYMTPADNEVRAWAIMGAHHMLALRYCIFSDEGPSEDVIDQAMALMRDGLTASSANQ